ncbi:uncharacterized protein [Oscarella lobularis]|uniref:uncharacterized protein n=1 Tax=Oscarella lobularis TaxID=121494 RepID=UPI0033133F0B
MAYADSSSEISFVTFFSRRTSRGWYMQVKCASQWPNDETRRKCENSTRSARLDDLLVSLPVSTQNLTYSNIYCAQCNFKNIVALEASGGLTYWTPKLYCDVGSHNVTQKLAESNYSAYTFLSSCSIAYFMAPQLNATGIYDPVRLCRRSVSTCLSHVELNAKLAFNITGSNYKCLKEKCHSYTDYIRGSNSHPFGGMYFRNRYCAYCNGLELNNLDRNFEFFGRAQDCFGCTAFFLALDFSPSGGVSASFGETIVTVSRSCSLGYVYDPSQLECVLLSCPQGFELVGSECRAPRTISIQILFHSNATDLQSVFTSDLSLQFQNLIRRFFTFENVSVEITGYQVLNASSLLVNSTLKSIVLSDKEWAKINSTVSNVNILFTYHGILFSSKEIAVESISNGDQLHCAVIQLNASQYNESSDGSIIDLTTDRTLNSSQYISLSNGSIQVCNTFETTFNKTTSVLVWDYDNVSILLSTIVSAITAVICYAIAFTYLFFKDLRNYPGLCMASYTFALGSSSALIIFGAGLVDDRSLCTSMGFLLHFFTVSHFTWSSVIAANVVRTFVTSRLRNPGIERRSRLRRYAFASLYAWSAPAIICTICVILDYESDLSISYSSDVICWLQPSMAVFFAMGIPAGVILVFNLGCFIRITVVLHRDMKSVAAARKEKSSEKVKKQARVYFGFFALLGLSFIFSQVAAFAQQDWLWYLFMAASLFQTIVLLSVFVLNDKVRRLYKEFFNCRSKGAASTSRPPLKFDSQDSVATTPASGTKMTIIVRDLDLPAPPKDNETESSQL